MLNENFRFMKNMETMRQHLWEKKINFQISFEWMVQIQEFGHSKLHGDGRWSAEQCRSLRVSSSRFYNVVADGIYDRSEYVTISGWLVYFKPLNKSPNGTSAEDHDLWNKKNCQRNGVSGNDVDFIRKIFVELHF